MLINMWVVGWPMKKKLFVAGIAAILVIAGFSISGTSWTNNATAAEEDAMMDDEMMGDKMMDDSMMDDSMMMKDTTVADITKAVVITDSSEFEKIRVYAGADVPTDGSGGAFGYGVISDAGLDAIIVTTTHKGVYDSVAQVDASDASFHNHYVALHDMMDDAKCPGLQVKDISYQEPGDVSVSGSGVIIEDAPYYFGATHSLSEAHISFNADSHVGNVVYFTIDPVDADGNTSVTDIAAVCINDVQFANVDDTMTIPAYYWEGH